MKSYFSLVVAILLLGTNVEAARSLEYSTSKFTESPENDGTIDNTIIITYSNTTGDSFTGEVGDDFVVAGKVVVANLPAGLNARILKTSNLTLVAVLTGTATAHTNANDISNLKFTFQNSAFGEGYALAVTNYIKSNIEINFKQIINVGSSGDYTTIAEALAVCDNGDIINLAAETFTEHSLEVGYGWNPYIHAIDDITIQGQGPGKTIVQGASSPGTDSGEVFTIGYGSNITIKDLTVRYGNSTFGGGIFCYANNSKLNNLDIYGNTTDYGIVGAIYVPAGYDATIENCSVHDNTGHGLSVFGSATVINSTIAKNARIGSEGGGIYCELGEVNLINCTIAENTGDGLWTYAGNISALNTIMANNSVVDYSVRSSVSLTDNGFNVIEKQSAYQINGNWRFTNPNDILYNYKADGSAGTQWTRNNAVLANQNLNIASAPGENSSINGTYTLALSSGSFAIDAAIGSGAPTTDQRGKARNGATDIGAFEYGGATVTLPTVSTTAISTYNATSATVGGTVSSDGGATVTEHGVVYSLSGTPDISDTKVQIGSGTGSFSQSVTGLLRGTTYFVRAYATNSVGTAYGSVQSFTTESGKPVISNLNGDTGIYTEGDTPLAIDHGENGTVSNPDSDFNGGKLTVSGANSISEFTQITPSINLALSNGMNSGSTITIGGTTIGSIATGKTGRMGSDLVISFNVNATDELVGTLLHHISYSNISEISLGTRSIYLTLQNALALTSDAAIVSISTSVANDAPTLTATGSNPIFIEGNSTVSLFSSASASTIESGQTFTGLTLTVSNVTDGGFEYLLLDESLILLTNGTTGTSSVNSLTYSVSVSGSTATVSITSASLSVANLQTLINSLGYKDNNADLTEADRVVTITTLNDSGGTDNGGDDTAELTVASSVSVISGNPVITNLNGDSGLFKEGDSPLLIDSGSDATVINNSDSGFNGGNLTVAISSASATESLLIKTSATVVLSSGMAAGSSVSIDGTVIGTIAVGKDGQDGHDLLVDLNASATTALIATLIQNISYSNNSQIDLGNRSVQVTVQNAIAFTSTVSTVTINAAAVNDPPTLTITATNPTFVEHGPATKVYSGAIASTFEPGQTFSEFAFTVYKLQDGSSEQVVLDGTYIALTAGNSGTTAINNLTYRVSVSFDVVWFAAVSVTGGSMSAESLQTVLNNLSYYNSSDSPTTTLNRIFRLTGLKDNGGTTNGGSNAVSLFINSYVVVVATSLPTVTTTAINIFNGVSATLGGNVTADGGTTVTERGVVYSTVDNTPTIGEANVTKNANGTTGTGTYSKTVTGLSPGNAYHVRAYAINAEGTAYGTVQSFSTSTVPTLSTSAIFTFDGTSATMGGNITDDGGVAVTERGVVYSLTDNTPVIGETDVTKANQGTTGAGSFSATINGLSRGATYYVRAYATNSAGTVYGSTESFTTKNYPVVVTSVAASVKIHSVVLGGDVTNDGGLTVTDRGFVFSSTDGTPTIEEDATKYAVGEGSGSFSSTISGLIAGTTYYFNTYAINSEGIVYGTPGSTTTASSSTFTGTADWNSDVNWSSGVPLTGGTAVIQGNPTIRDAKITVDKLKIYSGSVSLSVVNQLKIVHELYVDKNSSGIVITGN